MVQLGNFKTAKKWVVSERNMLALGSFKVLLNTLILITHAWCIYGEKRVQSKLDYRKY